jgi:hypothetical protein
MCRPGNRPGREIHDDLLGVEAVLVGIEGSVSTEVAIIHNETTTGTSSRRLGARQ